MTSHQLINQTSGITEYYTPEFIIEAARRVMGFINLDPASSERANERVKARRFFTPKEDGLAQEWPGNVWLNHPFGRISNPAWIDKAVNEFQFGNADVLMSITFASTSEAWFQPLLNYPQCFLCPRTNYLLPDGSVKRGVTKGSVVTYMGVADDLFAKVFSPFGKVK